MKRLAVVAFLVLVPSTAHADGCPPSQCGIATVAVAGSPLLHVRPGGAHGPLVAFDLRSGAERFRLPSGLLSADGRSYFVSRSTKTSATITRYDARTGRVVRGWRLAARRWVTAVSHDGRFLALNGRGASGRETSLSVFDTRRGAVVQRLTLSGGREPEAISPDGSRLFLVHWLPRGYRIELLDFETRTVSRLRAKGEPPRMTGTAWTAVASPEGRWLLTLYLQPSGRAAVHTLDILRNAAVCIDLPAADFPTSTRYAVTLAPGGRVAYAAAPELGVVATIDLARLKVVRVVRFAAARANGDGTFGFGSTAAVSPGGRTLAFSSGRGVWRYDTRTGDVRGAVRTNGRVTGLGFMPDGRLLVTRFGKAPLRVAA